MSETNTASVTDCTLSVSITIAGVNITLKGEKNFDPKETSDINKVDVGSFIGEASLNLNLKNFLSSLGEDIGLDGFSDIIPDIILKTLTVTYDRGAGIFTFTGDTCLETGGDIDIIFFLMSRPGQKTETDPNPKTVFIWGLDFSGIDLSKVNIPGNLIKGGLLADASLAPIAVYSSAPEALQDIIILYEGGEKHITLSNIPPKMSIMASVKAGGDTVTCALPLSTPESRTKTGTDGSSAEADGAAGSTVKSGDAAETSKGMSKWFKVNKTFGPLTIRRIGLGWNKGYLQLLFDASFSLSGLTITLQGFGLGIALKSITHWPPELEFELSGIAVTFDNPPLEISGGLVEEKTPEMVMFNGEMLISAENFAISALGSYGSLNGHPSLFVFALLDFPFGGPPSFFITGLAAGFGYNRGLKIPPIKDIKQFPLVAGALDSGTFPGGSDPGKALEVMGEYIYPSLGEYWVSAGIKFTTYELLKSFALVNVCFGTSFELTLIGISMLSIPSNFAKPIAQAELGLEVRIDPGDGIFAVTAAILPGSFVLTPDCRLEGGFAFYIWFDPNERAGDYVITLGGYHPSFDYQKYGYPAVDRLGFNWHVSSHIQIKGGVYFALTPSCIMAGGSLDATFHAGNLKAWFKAYADMIIQWKPFHYDFRIGVSIGASYRINLLFIHHTFTIELGASLHIWGPKLVGKAHIHWFIISFTIDINNPGSNGKPPVLEWKEFADSFLPKNKNTSSQSSAANGASGDTEDLAVCTVKATKGLLKQTKTSDGKVHWIINPHDFTLETASFIPSTKITIPGISEVDLSTYTTGLGIRPMAQPLDSTFTVSIKLKDVDAIDKSKEWISLTDLPANLKYEIIEQKKASQALWSPDAFSNTPSAGTISNVPVGIRFYAGTIDYYELPPLVISDNLDEKVPRGYTWTSVTQPVSDYTENAITEIKDTIMGDSAAAKAAVKTRNAIMDALDSRGILHAVDIDVSTVAKDAEKIFLAPPGLYGLGALEKKKVKAS